METARFWGIPHHRLATTTSSLSYRVLCGGVHYSQFGGALNQSVVGDGLSLRPWRSTPTHRSYECGHSGNTQGVTSKMEVRDYDRDMRLVFFIKVSLQKSSRKFMSYVVEVL
jgi:hypothetical protein